MPSLWASKQVFPLILVPGMEASRRKKRMPGGNREKLSFSLYTVLKML